MGRHLWEEVCWGAQGGRRGGQDSTSPTLREPRGGGFLEEVTPKLKSRNGNVSSLENLKRDVTMKELLLCLSPDFLETRCHRLEHLESMRFLTRTDWGAGSATISAGLVTWCPKIHSVRGLYDLTLFLLLGLYGIWMCVCTRVCVCVCAHSDL